MIARVWHGLTRASSAEEYLRKLEAGRVRAYRKSEGNRGVLVLRENRLGVTEFLVISLWESAAAIQQFTKCENIASTVHFERDYDHLIFPDCRVSHFEVVVGAETFAQKPVRHDSEQTRDIFCEPAD